jgi:hypothetical protein
VWAVEALTNIALNTRVRPNGRRTAIDAADIVLVAPPSIIPPRRADGAFFLRVVGELGFQYIAVEALSSLSRFDAV